MTRALRAELVKLVRPRVLALTAAASAAFAVAASLVVLGTADPAASARPGRGPGTTTEALSEAGGGTEVFATAAAFAGVLVFVLFVGATAIEFSRGTVRTMLLRQPDRLRLLAGKLGGLLAFAAVALAATELLTWLVARALASGQGIDAGRWLSLDGLQAGTGDYATVVFWVTGYAVLGTTLAVVARSVPVALGAGIAWAGPFEHLVQEAWAPAGRLFPGLLLEALVAGGTTEVSALQAFGTVAAYIVVAGALAGLLFTPPAVAAA